LAVAAAPTAQPLRSSQKDLDNVALLKGICTHTHKNKNKNKKKTKKKPTTTTTTSARVLFRAENRPVSQGLDDRTMLTILPRAQTRCRGGSVLRFDNGSRGQTRGSRCSRGRGGGGRGSFGSSFVGSRDSCLPVSR
jgi:hypothetical protein